MGHRAGWNSGRCRRRVGQGAGRLGAAGQVRQCGGSGRGAVSAANSGETAESRSDRLCSSAPRRAACSGRGFQSYVNRPPSDGVGTSRRTTQTRPYGGRLAMAPTTRRGRFCARPSVPRILVLVAALGATTVLTSFLRRRSRRTDVVSSRFLISNLFPGGVDPACRGALRFVVRSGSPSSSVPVRLAGWSAATVALSDRVAIRALPTVELVGIWSTGPVEVVSATLGGWPTRSPRCSRRGRKDRRRGFLAFAHLTMWVYEAIGVAGPRSARPGEGPHGTFWDDKNAVRARGLVRGATVVESTQNDGVP